MYCNGYIVAVTLIFSRYQKKKNNVIQESTNVQLLLANEAVARGLYEAGVTVVSSYPGTPSTEITETASKYKEIYTEWAPNEKVALEVAATAAIAGARSFCAMKHVGLNVAADPLFTMSYIGVKCRFCYSSC